MASYHLLDWPVDPGQSCFRLKEKSQRPSLSVFFNLFKSRFFWILSTQERYYLDSRSWWTACPIAPSVAWAQFLAWCHVRLLGFSSILTCTPLVNSGIQSEPECWRCCFFYFAYGQFVSIDFIQPFTNFAKRKVWQIVEILKFLKCCVNSFSFDSQNLLIKGIK